MIGRLCRGKKTLAILNDAGEWECEDALRLDYLRRFRNPTGLPSLGPFGASEIAAAARDCDCAYEYADPETSKHDGVY